MIITIDGPAGVGKGTIAKIISKSLGFKYLDSGAMYRALALFADLNGVSDNDSDRLKKMGEQTFRIKTVGSPQLDELKLIMQNEQAVASFSLLASPICSNLFVFCSSQDV